ncbi:MAG: diaminopimelate epimerase [Parachlamydiaceae bacterium]|nr:diaminopimelate epimerase [Parachlamydiaceae bacterium]
MVVISFSKYEGCGNDFIMIDNRNSSFNSTGCIQHLCNRQQGIGADGLILLENSRNADFRMRIFNPDGNEAEMCGNGARCLIKFIQELGISQEQYQIETMHKTLTAYPRSGLIRLTMGNPFDVRLNLSLVIENITYVVHHIDTGVPHLILFSPDYKSFPLSTLGAKFRNHPQFSPKGVNFNIATVTPSGEIFIRTYERGVEGETLACGTGCTAAAIAAALLYKLPSPITVHNQVGNLEIAFDVEKGEPVNVTMTGPATKTFSGTVSTLGF